MLGIGIFLGYASRGAVAPSGSLQGMIAGSSSLTGALALGLAGTLNGSTALTGSMTVGLRGTISGSTALTGDFASSAPNAPTLSLNSEVGGAVSLFWDIDETIAAGDTLTRQAQASGGNWSTLVDNMAHVITSGEDSADQITASLTLGNGTWDIRGAATSAATGGTSPWSTVLTITITDAGTANYRISSTGNRRISSAGNYRKTS